MKKKLAILLICAMFLSGFIAFAESTENKIFDHTVFKKYSDNYYYDKFDKEWFYADVYTKVFKEFNIDIALLITGNDSLQNKEDGTEYYLPPMSALSITVTSNDEESLYEVEKFSIFVDDKLYSYSNKETEKKSVIKSLIDSEDNITPIKEDYATNFTIMIGNIGKQMVEEIAVAKEVSMKLNFLTYKHNFLKPLSTSSFSTIIEPTIKEFSKIITICKNAKKYDIFNDLYYSDLINEDGVDYMSFADSESGASVK